MTFSLLWLSIIINLYQTEHASIHLSCKKLTKLEWQESRRHVSNFNWCEMFVFVHNKSNQSARNWLVLFHFFFTYSCQYYLVLSHIPPLFILRWSFQKMKMKAEQKIKGDEYSGKKQSEPMFEWKWQSLCKMMKNTGKTRRKGTVNIMSLFQHFGANHLVKCKISQSQRGRLLMQAWLIFLCNLWGWNYPFQDRKENKQQLVRKLFERVRCDKVNKW